MKREFRANHLLGLTSRITFHSSRHNMSSGFTGNGPMDIFRVGDNGPDATLFQIVDCSLYFGRHAAFRKVDPFGQIGFGFGYGNLVEPFLLRCSLHSALPRQDRVPKLGLGRWVHAGWVGGPRKRRQRRECAQGQKQAAPCPPHRLPGPGSVASRSSIKS